MFARPETTDREDALATLKAFIAAGQYNPGDRLAA